MRKGKVKDERLKSGRKETLRIHFTRGVNPGHGCTEPIAIAYAASVAGKVLGEEARRMELSCSGNIIKNVKAVAVPNAGGQKGIAVAGIPGLVGGNPEK